MSDAHLKALVVYAHHSQAVTYMMVVSLAVLVYDYCLTLDREVRLVWKYKWGVGNILFLLTRYSTFLDIPLVVWLHQRRAPSPGQCLTVYTAALWLGVFGIFMGDGILFLRTYAFYHKNKKVLAFLIFFYVVIVVVVIIGVHLFIRSLLYVEPPPGIRELGVCFAIKYSKIVVVAFCVVIFQQTVILSLTFFKIIEITRLSSSKLIKTLYRDGIFYYVYILLISIANIIVLIAGPRDLLGLLIPLQRTTRNILAARVLLHVREALHKDLGKMAVTNIYSPTRYQGQSQNI